MPYTPQLWLDGAAGATPISAARLNTLEQGVADAYDPPASDTVAGLVKLNKDVRGTYDALTVPPLGEVQGGTMAAQGSWIAPGRVMAPAILTNGVTGGQVVRVGRGCTIDKVAVNVTTAGTSGSVIRIGIYKLTYNQVTGALTVALLVDAGTVSGTSVATPELTLTTPLVVEESTNLWLTATGQGTPGTQPIITHGEMEGIGMPFSTAATALGTLGGLQATGNPTALPTTPTVSAINAPTPRVAFHLSA